MASARKHAQQERKHTDASLAHERGKADRELAKRTSDIEASADAAIGTARRRADEVLERARSRADETLLREDPDTDERVLVETQRQGQDEVLRRERDIADEKLSSERDAHQQALSALLALEREQTDHHLLVERDRVDRGIGSRDDFLAMTSHDLRNLLGGIALATASLSRIQSDDEIRRAIDRDAKRIQRFTASMSRLVGDLLDVVSIEAGRLAMVPKCHDAVELVRETCDVFEPIAATKGISIQTDVSAGALLVQCDHERILQVLANLLGNAIKFTPPGGKIDVLVESVAAEVRFAVADTGSGIPPDKLGAIFERFWQVPEKQRSGLGLGLYISRCIVEAHGGRIWAESRPGKGSTFCFTLPAAHPASPPGAANPP